MPTVLLYNIEPKKAAGIKLLCSMLFFDYRIVEPDDFGRPIGVLLGLSDDETNQPDSSFDEELLYLADIDGGMLDIFLFQLRKKKLSVPLKAVKTPSNLAFTSCELYRHLCAEREAIAQGTTAHTE
jgi:hypothetical protein